MRRSVLAVAALVLLAGCGAAYVNGMGPSPGNSEDIESFPTERPDADGSGAGSDDADGPDAVNGGRDDGSDGGSSDGGSSDGDGSATDGSASDGSTDDGSATDGSGDGTSAPDTPFTLAIERVKNCGSTCRDVTSTVTNERSTAAENVTVYTRVFAGNGTDGDVVWQGSEEVGRLDAGESYTTTRRVELSYANAMKVQNHDGWVTIQTTVQSDGEIVTVTNTRQVA